MRGRNHLLRLRRMRKDNMKMHPKETGCEVVDRMELAEGRVQWLASANTLMNLGVQERRGIS
jgi:hypothetical protein